MTTGINQDSSHSTPFLSKGILVPFLLHPCVTRWCLLDSSKTAVCVPVPFPSTSELAHCGDVNIKKTAMPHLSPHDCW